MTDLTFLIRPKSVPLRSIGLTQIDQNMPSHDMLCPCEMCNGYEHKKVNELLDRRTRQLNEKIAAKVKHKHGLVTPYYHWLIKHLIIPHHKIITKGIQIFIPEILFYKEGQANSIFCCREVDQPIIKRAHKQKISNTFILKIFGDRRRKYREVINTFLGKKKEVTIKKPKFGGKKQPKRQSKDGVVIKYNDGLEQLISQNQFLHLLQKRKQDQVWKQIYYIKNFIFVQDPVNRIRIVKFNRSDIKYEQMFKRTEILMKIYGQNIREGDKNYFSQEQQVKFCKMLLKQSVQVYTEYMLYKIVSYVQYFYDQKINNISVKFLINEMGQCFLEDVIKLQTEALIKFEWTNQTYLRKIDEEQQRVFFSKQVKVDEIIQKNASELERQMGKSYEKMKQFFGLSMVEEDNFEEKANNQFFKKIHPEIQSPISQLLKTQGMTINKFKRDFLGYKPEKKPIVKPFTSNLIKSLHNLTPQLRRADPHQFVKIPKRTLSTAFSSSSKRKNYSLTKQYHKHSSNFVTALSTPRDN